mmetsp:Transcript_37703/g.87060  ORF Transcript_37703/g.87060 Transcript_37703/m.87060 type:complete len:210 (-) Transcript_37703:164-793(-)
MNPHAGPLIDLNMEALDKKDVSAGLHVILANAHCLAQDTPLHNAPLSDILARFQHTLEPGTSSTASSSQPREYLTREDVLERRITSLMITNLPHNVRPKNVLEKLDETGFQDTYDFLYLPRSLVSGSNLGYGFVNFMSIEWAAEFVAAWAGQDYFNNSRPRKHLAMLPAAVQGFDELVTLCDIRKKMHTFRNQSFRPFIGDPSQIPHHL